MAHDSPRMFIPAISTKCSGVEGASGSGLAPIEITSCLPPTPASAAAAAAIVAGASSASPNASKLPIVDAMSSLSSTDTLASFPTGTSPLMVHVDRPKVIGMGQYSTVCQGTLEQPFLSGTGAGTNQLIPCAIKIPHSNNLDARELGLIEAAAFSRLGHGAPATVRCFGMVDLQSANDNGVYQVIPWPSAAPHAISGKGEWALVLEYCEKGSCWTWMMQNKATMDAELFFHWTRQLTLALAALHATGMAHKDIKPHNMLLDRNGDVRLADFTATEFSSEALAAMRAECPEFDPNSYPPYADFCGTIPYSAPEALSPALGANLKTKDAIHKMDIYSLGVSLYSLFVSGREPYASVKSSVEQMLFATKGAFWEWEERQYLAAMSSSLPQAPKVPHPLERHNTDAGIRSHPPSPKYTVATVQNSGLSRSLSLELGPRPRRRRTLKSRKAAPREFLRFLSGDPLPPDIESLLRDMANPNPSLRPTAGEILARLDSVEPEIFEP